MPWINLGTVAPGDVLRANSGTAAYNSIIGNIRMGEPVFTNEAARDAAITSPEEGMRAYLTAPTVPAATGAITAVPTGVTTVYNGSVWVCQTEVAARSTTAGTTTSTSYATTLTTDTTAISVTLVTGTTAMISHGLLGYSSGAAYIYQSISVSGATTLAAADANGIADEGVNGIARSLQMTYVLTGLTAGTNTFTIANKVNALTGNFVRRHLVVKGVV